MQIINITSLTRLIFSGGSLAALTACGFISARLAEEPVTRLAAFPPSQPCDAEQESRLRLTGTYLRQSEVTGSTFEPVLVTGRNTANGLADVITLNDRSQTREVQDARGTIFIGPEGARVRSRPGFGPAGLLPNVYDVSYSIGDARFSGPLVVGPGSVLSEIPGSGGRVFNGRIAVKVITQNDSGSSTTVQATGRFSFRAGYASGRGDLTASGFGADFPFDELAWRDLFLCGTRFVSSGSGAVTVRKAGGPSLQPFKETRAKTPLKALFDASQFPPVDRPAPPQHLGGVFVVQSDTGTMTGVFLSDQPVIVEIPEDEDA